MGASKEVMVMERSLDERFRTKNLSEVLECHAKDIPGKTAVVHQYGWNKNGKALYRSITFKELEEETNRYARGLSEAGIGKGTRTILMVRPSIEFFALTFALIRLGAVLVLIDPGMGRKKLVSSLGSVDAEVFIGVPMAHVLRLLSRNAFKKVRVNITVGRRWFWGGKGLTDVRSDDKSTFAPVEMGPYDMVGIFFTSGSTGPPKGVVYEHSMFDAQIEFLRSHFGYGRNGTDLATFPLFSLFDSAMGMTSVVPDMDATKPGKADPVKLVAAVKDQHCTQIYGSPALLENLARYCKDNGTILKGVRTIVTAGAPIRPDLLVRLREVLPEGAEVHTPYGATEALPVTDISSTVILKSALPRTEKGAGTCVGKPLPGNRIRIIAVKEGPIMSFDEVELLSPFEIGEICVNGPSVTKEYYKLQEQTRKAKIRDGDGSIWHRMGDTGYLDREGNLWFCGRVAHRVVTEKGTLYPVRCEAIFNKHPKVHRSALVGIGPKGKKRPVIVIEPMPDVGKGDHGRIRTELLALGSKNELTRDIRDIIFHSPFPMDIRHNAKINRDQLSILAGRRVR